MTFVINEMFSYVLHIFQLAENLISSLIYTFPFHDTPTMNEI